SAISDATGWRLSEATRGWQRHKPEALQQRTAQAVAHRAPGSGPSHLSARERPLCRSDHAAPPEEAEADAERHDRAARERPDPGPEGVTDEPNRHGDRGRHPEGVVDPR